MSMVTAARREARASYAFVERNFNLSKRYLGWEVVFLLYNVAQSLSILYIGASFGGGTGAMGAAQHNEVILYLAIGALLWSYLSVVFEAISETITWERWEGTIEYTLMAPISRVTHLLGSSLYSVTYSLLRTAVILVVLGLFFHLDLRHTNLGATVVVILLSSLSFLGIGIMAAALPLLFTERGTQMTLVASAVLLLISGVYYPVSVLPRWMQLLATISPANYALNAIRRAVMRGAGLGALWPDIWPLALIGALTIPLGFLVFQRAERYAKRTGRLKRSG